MHHVDSLTNNEQIAANPTAIYVKKLTDTFTFEHNPGYFFIN